MKNKFAKLLNSVSKKLGFRFSKIKNRVWYDDFVGLNDFEKKTKRNERVTIEMIVKFFRKLEI